MTRTPAPQLTGGWVVGRAAGAPVIVSPGWLLAAVALTYVFAPTVRSLAPGIGAGAYVVSGAFVLLLLVSVFVHELAHALVARRRGIEVRELAVTLLGGHTRFGAEAPDPVSSSLVALAGPVANLVLGGLAWAASSAMTPGLPRLVVAAAAVANGFVGLFNLVPGLPLDGGRVLEAVVWRTTGDRARGTLVAAWGGRLVAVGVLAWVLLEPLARGRTPSLLTVVWGALVGAFLWSGASAALQQARTQGHVDRLAVRALMHPAVPVPQRGALADLARVPAGSEMVLVDEAGLAVGVVDRAALAAVPPGAHSGTPVTAVAVPLPAGAYVDVDLVGRSAVQAVAAAASASAVVAVTGPSGVVGVLRAQDVIDAIRGRRAGSGTGG